MGLFSRFRKAPVEDISPLIPAGQRVYCIGDIHGRADLLQQLHAQIQTDGADYSGHKTIVYLGDYIDRGEQSRQVIELILTQPLPGYTPVYLRGNHEQAMLDFMLDPQAAASWLSFGGREALNSYGIPLAYIPTARDIPKLGKQLADAIPEAHLAFLQFSLGSWQCGTYYFVHAGVRPGVALENQQIEDQMWIRDEFLSSQKNHGAIIIHGHSINPEPQIHANRIGIDTGAYSSGVLTCLVLEGESQRFLQTGRKDV